MSEQIQAVLWTGAGLVVVALIGLLGNYFAKRLRGRASEPEMWERIDALTVEIFGNGTPAKPGLIKRLDAAERRDIVKGYIISALVKQWPEEHKPKLDPNYLAELDEDTLPLDHPWRTRP